MRRQANNQRQSITVKAIKNTGNKVIRINALDTEQPAKNQISAEVSVTAHVENSGFGGDPPSSWQLVWEKTNQGWQLREIRAVKLPGMDLNTIIGRWKP